MVRNAVNQPCEPCWSKQRPPWFRARANVQESSTHSMLRRNWTFAAKAHDEYMLRRYYPVCKDTAVNQLWAYRRHVRVRKDGGIQARTSLTW
jgi:hypothetical protein